METLDINAIENLFEYYNNFINKYNTFINYIAREITEEDV